MPRLIFMWFFIFLSANFGWSQRRFSLLFFAFQISRDENEHAEHDEDAEQNQYVLRDEVTVNLDKRFAQ